MLTLLYHQYLLRDLTASTFLFTMKILSWNVIGLGRPSKRHLVKDLILSSLENIVCIQESKLQDLHSLTWRSIGGSRLDTFDFLPALGSARGIIMAWDSSQVIDSLIHKGSYSIMTRFTNRENNSVWAYTSVYAPFSWSLKTDFWNELRTIKNPLSSLG